MMAWSDDRRLLDLGFESDPVCMIHYHCSLLEDDSYFQTEWFYPVDGLKRLMMVLKRRD